MSVQRSLKLCGNATLPRSRTITAVEDIETFSFITVLLAARCAEEQEVMSNTKVMQY